MVNREEQKCLISGETQIARLIRLAVSPHDELVPDIGAKLPGQGVWVMANKAVITKALETGVFNEALHCKLIWPPDFTGQIGRLLETQLLNLLGLARRAGALQVGFTKVEKALKKQQAQLVLCASDGAVDGRSKIAALGRHQDVLIDTSLTCASLSAALGRENIVHVAVVEKGWSDRVGRDISRMALYHNGEMNLKENETIEDE